MSHLTQVQPDEFIIAIGASAGGMEAIHTLFDNTPTDAVAYVIIQHLSPDHKSLMAELLVKHSILKIFEVTDGMMVMPNCIYVMPSGKNMTISKGILLLKDRKASTPNSAIDIFFNSLAEDQGTKSIAIVLSGNGSDGTKGVAAIKKVGGMVIVQEPDSTAYNSMPLHAIESGNYDYILSPALIPQQIIKYVARRLLTTFSDEINDTHESALLEIMHIIKEHSPLDFSEYKRPTIIRRIIRRIHANNSHSIAEYIELLKSTPLEIDILAKEFLISVTGFFRDPAAFEVIRTSVIPDIIVNKLLVDTLKVWVIGCATGEEAYSLAILIKEHLLEIKKDIDVKIFASDIDKDALLKASKGLYHESKISGMSQERRDTFFIREGNFYKVRENIRNMIIFADHDIVHQPPYGKIDFISCRNMLIYFNPTLQKKIFATMHFCLNIGGYLFLGPSEGVGHLKNVFREIDKKWKIYKNIEGTSAIGLSPYFPQHVEVKKYDYPSLRVKQTKSSMPDNLSEIIAQSNLEESGFSAGVCLDESNKIIQPFGNFEKYLVAKLFNNNILELLPPELSIAAGNTIKKAMQEDICLSVTGIQYYEGDVLRSVKILVKPFLHTEKVFQNIVILYFAEELVHLENAVTRVTEQFDKDTYEQRYVLNMKQELAVTTTKLEAAYLALEDSNDNIQSYNEELISGNEEMQSANEELQSINEELNTVNSEYQVKIKELAELNDDFNNYFKSTHHSQIYVDKNLIIKKFTPASVRQINIKDSDIGRPLADISTNIKFSSLMEDIHEVILTQISKEKHIETTNENWYSMFIMPYIRAHDGKADGAIISFNDITDLKKSKEIIQNNNRKLVKINEDHDTFIYSVSHDLKAPLNNMEGLISILGDSEDKEEIQETILLLNESVVKLRATIEELAEITQMENGDDEVAQVDVISLLEEVKVSIGDLLLESNAILYLEIEVGQIPFSRKNLRSILLNLLSNAFKYRSKDRRLKIIIKTKLQDGFIVFTVKDNGLGIADEVIGKVFSKFKRAHDLESNIEGTGVGLYLVKKIINNAGGRIEVDSTLGQGSVFKVYFKY